MQDEQKEEAKGQSKDLYSYVDLDDPKQFTRMKLQQFAQAVKKKRFLAGVPKWQEIADILLWFKEEAEKRLAGIHNQKKALDQQEDGIMIQVESLVWLEAAIRGTPYQPLGPLLGVMLGLIPMEESSSAEASPGSFSASSILTTAPAPWLWLQSWPPQPQLPPQLPVTLQQ